MLIELLKAGLIAETQHQITVYYQTEVLGHFYADIIVEDTIIVELKSVKKLVQAQEVQLVNYLTAKGKPVDLLLNFGEHKVEVKRKVKNLH